MAVELASEGISNPKLVAGRVTSSDQCELKWLDLNPPPVNTLATPNLRIRPRYGATSSITAEPVRRGNGLNQVATGGGFFLPGRHVPDIFENALARLRRLEDGWDGEDAAPPSDDSLHHASELARQACVEGIRPSHIMACVDGGVTVVFSVDERTAVVDILNEGVVVVVTCSRAGSSEAISFLQDESTVETVLGVVRELLA